MVILCLLLLTAAFALPAQPPASPEETRAMLERIAARQKEAVDARTRWSFQQQVLVRLYRGKNKLAREELRSYHVRPMPDRVERELKQLTGRVEIDGKLYPYTDPAYRTGDIDLDGEIAESLAQDLGANKDEKDGVADDDLFPLSEKMMASHDFTYRGTESYRGREVHRFEFVPAKQPRNGHRGFWEGELLVDRATDAPVLMVTHQARGVPMPVRVLLGSNVRKLGFKLEYGQMDDGVWFPLQYSGEFQLRVLFGYGRTISLSVRNQDFVRASAETSIRYDGPVEQQP